MASSTSGKEVPESSSWLLRFFKSDFFDAWIAVSYIFKYKDVGIQDYLCQQLMRFPLEDVQYFLPQLWSVLDPVTRALPNLAYFSHILLYRPHESAALEFLLIENCVRSTHFAILVWNSCNGVPSHCVLMSLAL